MRETLGFRIEAWTLPQPWRFRLRNYVIPTVSPFIYSWEDVPWGETRGERERLDPRCAKDHKGR